MNDNNKGNNIFDDQNPEEDDKSRPSVVGEGSVSGSATDPEGIQQEDTLDMAHDMGLYLNQDEEHPGELGLAGQVNSAEGVIGDVGEENEAEDELKR